MSEKVDTSTSFPLRTPALWLTLRDSPYLQTDFVIYFKMHKVLSENRLENQEMVKNSRMPRNKKIFEIFVLQW